MHNRFSDSKRATLKARWYRALDELTALAMRETLPDCCEWILHATLTWLLKGTQQEAEDDAGMRWRQLCRQAQARQQGGQVLEEDPQTSN